MARLSERELVAWLKAQAATAGAGLAPLPLGIGDDAALIAPAPGQHLAWTTDTLVAGVHFPVATHPADIGWKTLAVNLSDLAAMGAEPRWVSLNLSLPDFDSDWIAAFATGFFELAQLHGVHLIGGDCTRATEPVLTVTAIGQVPEGQALRRDRGQIGDALWISGWPGEAAAGLSQHGQVGADPHLRARLDRPAPRIALGQALRGLAHAAMDVSDGLLLDLDRLCAASDCGARLEQSELPVSPALRRAARDPEQALDWLLAGGDDYELLFSAPSQSTSGLRVLADRLDLPLHRIGTLVAATHGVRVCDAEGRDVPVARRGYEHCPP